MAILGALSNLASAIFIQVYSGLGKKVLQTLVQHPAIAIRIAAIEGWEQRK
ncbi:MAG: hypothetical protein AAFW84_00180 [Cyanobacteria bacterium J06635_15]